ncbi:hypothetical protein FRC08_004968 [Ceratobasidium sp. 394]|nr:hypothetical protein FRC08_004968 [Ceratobasidium sp. 394]
MNQNGVSPVQVRDEKHWREYYTAARPNKWIYECVDQLAAGLKREPRVLQEKGDVRSPDTISNVIEAVVEEVARQFHGLSIYTCAMWKEGKDRMVTTQAMCLPDPHPEANRWRSATVHHFAHFALGYGGISGGLDPENAYPVAWPDFEMAARPALPPRHPNWNQEKGNVVDWFEKLWSWEGAYDNLEWAVIVTDINEGNFKYFEKHRLPAEYAREKDRRKFMEPAEWDEETTVIWSNHIRSAMDVWGRVMISQINRALQFRQVDQQYESKIYETFLLEPPQCCDLDWQTPALLFEKRVKRAMAATPARVGQERANTLYKSADRLVAEVGDRVRGLASLLVKLREYESFVPAEVATIPATERSHDWHPAAAQVSRTLETFADNTSMTKHVFPEEFLSRLARGHYRWDVTAFRDWIESNPFWEGGAKMLRGGTAGIAVAFFAILHYALNVARVMPKDDEEAGLLCDRDQAVYGRADFRTLTQCVERIAQQIEAATLASRSWRLRFPPQVDRPSMCF